MLLCETAVCVCVCVRQFPFRSSSTPLFPDLSLWSSPAVPRSLPSPCICEGRCCQVAWSCSVPWDYNCLLQSCLPLTPYFLLLNLLLFEEGHGGLSWWSSGWEATCQWKGHRFDLWTGKLPHAVEQQSPGATTTEPVFESLCAAPTEAWVPRLLNPTLELVLHNKRSHHKEKPTCYNKSNPHLAQRDKAHMQQERSNEAKNN